MFISKRLAVSAVAMMTLGACATQSTLQQSAAPGPTLGRVASVDEVKAWSISIPPSGVGLPAGSGSVQQGLAVYTAKCVSCHGEKGAGKPADAIAGGKGTLASANAVRTVGSYWPYAPTIYDDINRAMPYNSPQFLAAGSGLRSDRLFAAFERYSRSRCGAGCRNLAESADAEQSRFHR